MINNYAFRMKENGEPDYRCICRHPELIENYDKAVADTMQTWEVHHRLESCFTQKFLKEMNLYYDVQPEALIFLTREEHNKIDSKRKRHSERLSKKVLCLEIGKVFDSIKDASRQTGINNISMACNGKRKTAGGLHWKFYN